MRTRIRLWALAVVALGGTSLASPRAAHATYSPPEVPSPLACCCEAVNGGCGNRCCSPNGCTITAGGCTTPTARR